MKGILFPIKVLATSIILNIPEREKLSNGPKMRQCPIPLHIKQKCIMISDYMYLINSDELMNLSDHGTIIRGYTQLFKIFLNIFDMVVIPETFEFTSYLPVLERK